MKRGISHTIKLAVIMLLLFGTTRGSWADEQYVYEKRDEVEEKKQYVIQLERDKQKCDLAILNTKTLISRSKNKPYLPELYLRLAELYIEKSRTVYFLRKSNLEAGEAERALDQYEANTLKQRALEIYQRILSDFPDFPDCDKIVFFMAHEYRELGKIDEMLKQYHTIVTKYPDSTFAPESHLLLGDYYFSQKQDVEKSTAEYQAVLKYPDSPAVAAARYKLAWCRINVVDFKGALKLFEESVRSGIAKEEMNIDTYRRVDVRLESLIDMAYCYPEVYKKAKAEDAIVYFKKYAWSRPVYTTVLEKLAYRFYVKKKWSQAAAVYRELATLRQDPEKLSEYAKHIFESVQALGKYERAEKDVGIIIRALEKQKYSVHVPEEEKAKMMKDYELYARDIITHLHDKARKTSSRKDFRTAADAYKLYLDFFTDSVAHDEMAGNYAEVLFSSGQYLEAGKQYEKVTPAATVNTKQRMETLYSAVIAYYQALKKKDNLNYYQTAFARQGLRDAGKSYAAEFPRSKHTPDVLFNVAWVSYDAGEYDDAIKDFSNFVAAYPRSKAAKPAVHLIMDAYNLTEDYEGMISYGKSVLRSQVGDARFRQEIAQIVKGAEGKVVSTMTMAAMDDWDSAREELMQVVDEGGSSTMSEQALYALVLSSRDKNDLPTLYDASEKLIRKFPNSENAKGALQTLINTSVKIGQYRLLSDYLEEYARRYPGEGNAAKFRLQAARIQEGLGQYAEANANYRLLLKAGQVSRNDLEAVIFSYVDNAVETGNIDTAIRMLNGNLKQLSGQGQVKARALMGVLNLRSNRRSTAFKLYHQAKKGYRPSMGENDPLLLGYVAELAYNQVHYSSGRYYGLKLKNTIDNAIVSQKADMLAKLEQGYQQVMSYKSPGWTLKACFRANELNHEFAEFLLTSPVPRELNDQERAQYRQLIQQKAQAYQDKADQYLKTCIEIARKWALCDPQLAGYFTPEENPSGRDDSFNSLAGRQRSAEVAKFGLKDPAIGEIYLRLLKKPDDLQYQLALAKAYMKQGDFLQATLIAQNALPNAGAGQGAVAAQFYNILGVAYLNKGNDPSAKDAFEQAMSADGGVTAARINLAGLYRHYGHQENAAKLLKTATPSDLHKEGVHPRIGAMSNAYSMQTK